MKLQWNEMKAQELKQKYIEIKGNAKNGTKNDENEGYDGKQRKRQ